MNGENPGNPACRVCGRTLLPGERPIELVSASGEPMSVCSLCKPRAEAAGWLRPDQAAALREQGGLQDRRRGRAKLFSGVLGRGRERAERPARERHGGRDRRASRAAAERAPEPRQRDASATVNPTVADALEAFNASPHRRTVRGLTRSLGEPRASGLAIRTDNGATGARLTVVWELAWYQWEVAPGKRGLEVRESRKGETVDQLRAADRTWNLAAASDGTLRVRSGAPAEQG